MNNFFKQKVKLVELVYAIGIIFLSSCNVNSKTNSNGNSVQQDTVSRTNINIAVSNLSQKENFEIDNRQYQIIINRSTDKMLPLVEDENGEKFFSTKVEVKISCDGENYFSKTFLVDDFKNLISASDFKLDILQGMAFDKDKSEKEHKLILGAQVGQPGMDGDGQNFSILIKENNNFEIKKIETNVSSDDELGD